LVSQLREERDPELRRALMLRASQVATPSGAAIFRDQFLQVLQDDKDSDLRLAAVRGLRYAEGPEAEEALGSAAADPSEEIRLAAVEALASRPDAREELRDLIERDPSTRVREIGRCELLLKGLPTFP
jgi:HEAT repeat protein